MKIFKKAVAILTLAATLMTSTSPLKAECCYADGNPGCGYADCCAAPCISPTLALGAIAIAAIIAVVVQNRRHGHGHKHGSDPTDAAHFHSHSHYHAH